MASHTVLAGSRGYIHHSNMTGTPGETFGLQLVQEVAIMQILSNVEDILATLKEVKETKYSVFGLKKGKLECAMSSTCYRNSYGSMTKFSKCNTVI